MIYIPIFVNIVLLLLFGYRYLFFSLVYTSFNDVNILINSELCNNIQSLLTQKTCYTWYSLRSALNRRSLCSGFSCIPSTIITRSRHSMG